MALIITRSPNRGIKSNTFIGESLLHLVSVYRSPTGHAVALVLYGNNEQLHILHENSPVELEPGISISLQGESHHQARFGIKAPRHINIARAELRLKNREAA